VSRVPHTRSEWAGACLALLLVWLVAYPLLLVAAEGLRGDAGPTLEWVRRFFGRRNEWGALWGSLWISIASVVMSALIGVPLAFLFTRVEFPGRRLLAELVALPVVLPPLVGVIAFLFLWGETGFVAHLVQWVTGTTDPPWRLQGAGGILLVHAYSMYVYFYLFTRAALRNIDGAAYTTSIAGTHVVASGPADTTLGVSMAKDYSADAASGWIKIAYTIKATKGQRAAPWEVSRVPRGGIVFFPVPSASAVTKGPLTITTANNIVWFDDAPKTATSPTGEKLFADGTTWTAYLLGRNLFLKRFTDTPASMQPTNEGEIDVYPGNGFLEFEVQGPYTQIAANGSLPWSIEWKVVTVPTSIAVTSGSTALVDFAKQQVAQ